MVLPRFLPLRRLVSEPFSGGPLGGGASSIEMKLSNNLRLNASTLRFCSLAANCDEEGTRGFGLCDGRLGGSFGACRMVELEPVVPFEWTEAREVDRARIAVIFVEFDGSSEGVEKGKGNEVDAECEGIGAG